MANCIIIINEMQGVHKIVGQKLWFIMYNYAYKHKSTHYYKVVKRTIFFI